MFSKLFYEQLAATIRKISAAFRDKNLITEVTHEWGPLEGAFLFSASLTIFMIQLHFRPLEC